MNIFKSTIYLFVLLFCCKIDTQAQQNFYHEFAIDAAPLIKSSGGYNFMYRFHKNNFSLRLQANIFYEITSGSDNLNSSTPIGLYSKSTINSSLYNLNEDFRIGFQKNWEYDNWSFYGGCDLLYLNANTKTTSETIVPNTYGKTRNTSEIQATSGGYGFAPLIGINYMLNKHFFISLENSFAFTFSHNTVTQIDKYYFTPVNGVEALNNTTSDSKSGDSNKFDFTPSKYMRLFMGFKF